MIRLIFTPTTYNLICNNNTPVQIGASTTSSVKLGSSDGIYFDFPSGWSISSSDPNWTYNTTAKLLSPVSSAELSPVVTNINLTINPKSYSGEKETVQARIYQNGQYSAQTPVTFNFMESANYLLAGATNSVFYLNSAPGALQFNNTLQSSLLFLNNNDEKSYTPSIDINFYTHDTLGNITELKNIQDSLGIQAYIQNSGSPINVTTADNTTWSLTNFELIPNSYINNSLSFKISKFNLPLNGSVLEARFTVSGIADTSYATSAYYQILGPFSLCVGFDPDPGQSVSTSQYCLSGDALNGYAVGYITAPPTGPQPPLSIEVLNQYGNTVNPVNFGGSLYLNSTDLNETTDVVFYSTNTLSLVIDDELPSKQNVLVSCKINLNQLTTADLPAGWVQITNSENKNYLCGPGQNLSGLDLSNCNFYPANLTNVIFTNTKLRNSNMANLCLSGAALTNADLTRANLSNAYLSYIISGEIISNSGGGNSLSLPTNWQLINGYLVGPYANLAAANLANMNLSTCNLSNANLTGANLTNTTLPPDAVLSYVTSGGIQGTPAFQNPTNWQPINGYLVGPNANLANADLYEQNLSTCNLSNANLIGANLDKTTLPPDADLVYVTSGGIQGTPVFQNASNWQLINGYLVGPKANLINADLSQITSSDSPNLKKADLSDAQLISADLAGTDLSNANLTGMISGNTIGPPSVLPTGWSWDASTGQIVCSPS